MISLDDVLATCGYKSIDDLWHEDGRRTYLHNVEATRDFMINLGNDLRLLVGYHRRLGQYKTNCGNFTLWLTSEVCPCGPGVQHDMAEAERPPG